MGVWVDTDMGVDDVMAILMLAESGQVDGISLAFGCADLDAVRRNALAFLAAYGFDIPLSQGADRALNGDCETCERILGPIGQPTRGAHFPSGGDRALPAASDALAQWLEARRDADILALGPLTNIARLCADRPDLVSHIRRIVWMGGSVGRGNHTPFAEFNAYADPEAADGVLRAGAPVTMVDLEICRQVVFGPAHLSDIPAQGALADLIGGYLDIGLSRGREGMALYDPVAAAAMLRPDLFTQSAARLSVVLTDVQRGRTIADPDPAGPHRILTGVQSAAARDLILSAMRDPA